MSIVRTQRLREAVTKTAKLLARDKIEVTQRGGAPHVKYRPDGSVEYVNLPMIPENPTPEYMDALQGFLDHEVAHVLFTDNAAATALMAKICRAERLDASRLAMFQNIFEDVRIERLMRLQFQGSGYNLSKALDAVLSGPVKERLAAARQTAPDQRDGAIVGAAFVAWTRSLSGDPAAKLFMDENGLWPFFQPVIKAVPDMERRLSELATTEDTVRLAADFLRAISPPPEKEEEKGGSPEPEGGEPGEGEKGEKKSEEDGEGEGEEGENEGGENEGDGEGEGGEGDDAEAEEGEGAGGSEEESDSEKHKGDDGASEDGTPEDHKTQGEDGSEQEGDEEFDGGAEEDPEGEDNRTLTEAMRLLDATHRKLITDYNKNGKSVEQIASERGVSPSVIASELKEARRNLKRYMKGVK